MQTRFITAAVAVTVAFAAVPAGASAIQFRAATKHSVSVKRITAKHSHARAVAIAARKRY